MSGTVTRIKYHSIWFALLLFPKKNQFNEIQWFCSCCRVFCL